MGGRIHFRGREIDDDPASYVTPETLAEKGIAFACIDGAAVDEYGALNSLAAQLQTEHPPYDPNPPGGANGWIRFLDDLETPAQAEAGMVIVIDNATELFAKPASWAFKLISIWVLQLPGWHKRQLPRHLTFSDGD